VPIFIGDERDRRGRFCRRGQGGGYAFSVGSLRPCTSFAFETPGSVRSDEALAAVDAKKLGFGRGRIAKSACCC